MLTWRPLRASGPGLGGSKQSSPCQASCAPAPTPPHGCPCARWRCGWSWGSTRSSGSSAHVHGLGDTLEFGLVRRGRAAICYQSEALAEQGGPDCRQAVAQAWAASSSSLPLCSLHFQGVHPGTKANTKCKATAKNRFPDRGLTPGIWGKLQGHRHPETLA